MGENDFLISLISSSIHFFHLFNHSSFCCKLAIFLVGDCVRAHFCAPVNVYIADATGKKKKQINNKHGSRENTPAPSL